MLLSLRKNGLTSLFKEVRAFKGGVAELKGEKGGGKRGAVGQEEEPTKQRVT